MKIASGLGQSKNKENDKDESEMMEEDQVTDNIVVVVYHSHHEIHAS